MNYILQVKEGGFRHYAFYRKQQKALMHKGDVERRKVYILSLTADYDNDFMYFKSEFRSMDALNAKLKTTRVKWKEDKGN